MLDNLKVIWREGMFLQPQHFQQAERFLSHNINGMMTYYQPYYFGITEIEIDTGKLNFQNIAIKKCSGIFPDGTMFSIPLTDDSPLERNFSDYFAYQKNEITVFLALPSVVNGKEIVSQSFQRNKELCRFESRMCIIPDEIDTNQCKEIELAELHFNILFEGEPTDGFVTMKIAKITRMEGGRYIIRDDFIPPLLQICASGYIESQLGVIMGKIINKCNVLSGERRIKKNGIFEYSFDDEDRFRLYYAINNYAPLINSYYLNPVIHPFQLYSLLIMFAGAICSFLSNNEIINFPVYNHFELDSVFGKIFKIINRILNIELNSECVIYPIEKQNSTTYKCIINDPQKINGRKMFLGAISKMPEKELIIYMLQRMKICPSDKLNSIVSSATSGIAIIKLSANPKQLVSKENYVYFTLDTENDLWIDVINSGELSFYLPNLVHDLKMELISLCNN